MPIDDPLGAFVPHARALRIAGAGAGPLHGLSFAAKDIYDVAGHVTGCGNPDWLATHGPAAATAPAVQALLDAGADLDGKTITDELAFSLQGENFHYGTPLNPAAPDRVPGGSSSGSASAVAGALVDFALGSDTGGSVRAPASYCGLWGIRTSHGAIALDHVMPLAPSFDTVGWFARTAALLERVGGVLLPPGNDDSFTGDLLIAEDGFALALPQAIDAFTDASHRVARHFEAAHVIRVSEHGLSAWQPHFQILQFREVWLSHGEWVTRTRPHFGPGIADRFRAVAAVTDAQVAEATACREDATERLNQLLGGDRLLLVPTVPGAAPLKGLAADEVQRYRQRALSILCIAGLCRLPQVSLPLTTVENCPAGLSLIGPRGSDRRLLATAARIAAGYWS